MSSSTLNSNKNSERTRAEPFTLSLGPPYSSPPPWQNEVLFLHSSPQPLITTSIQSAPPVIPTANSHSGQWAPNLLTGAVVAALAARSYFYRQLQKGKATFEIKPQFNTFVPLPCDGGKPQYQLRILDATRAFSVFSVFNVEGLNVYKHSFICDILASIGIAFDPAYRLRNICLKTNRPDSVVALDGNFGSTVWMNLTNRICAGTSSGTEFYCLLTSEKPTKEEKFAYKHRLFLLKEEDLKILRDSIEGKLEIKVRRAVHERRIRTLQEIVKNLDSNEYVEGIHFCKMLLRILSPQTKPPNASTV